jgi:hypothetical protein
MTGHQLGEGVGHSETTKVSTLLSTQGVQSFINYQNEDGCTSLHITVGKGHVSVTKHLLSARCNVDIQEKHGSQTCPDDRRHIDGTVICHSKK